MSKKIRSQCAQCNSSTFHDVLFDVERSGDQEYMFEEHHMVVECRGCGNISFRYTFKDMELGEQDGDGNWEFPEEIEIYPNKDDRNSKYAYFGDVPSVIVDIYNELSSAIDRGNFILAGVGLRAVVEAICNDKGIVGRNLESKISKMATQGLISVRDAERLHALRFLGNDAAHEIKKIPRTQVDTAKKIIDHTIDALYVIDREARAFLPTTINQYDDFLILLKDVIRSFNIGEELPLVAFLGRDARRVAGGFQQYEGNVISDIGSGSIGFLSVGKVDAYGVNATKTQFFKKSA